MLRIIAALLLIAAPVMAQDKPFDHAFRNMTGGVNPTSAPMYLPDAQSPWMMNMDEDQTFGALTSRRGSVVCGNYPTGNQVVNMWQFSRNAGTQYLVATDGYSVYATQDCNSWTKVKDGLPYDYYEFATVNNKLWVTSQSIAPFTWDGSNTVLLDGSGTSTTAPLAKHILYWQSRVWMANTSSNGSELDFTVLADTTGAQIDPTLAGSFSALYQLWINPSDGGQINAIIPYRGYLLVFKDSGIWQVQFQDEYNLSVSKALSSVGCVAGDTVREYNGSIYFLGKDGEMYTINMWMQVQHTAHQLNAILKNVTQPQFGLTQQLYNTDVMWQTGTIKPSGAFVQGDNLLELSSAAASYTLPVWPAEPSTTISTPAYSVNMSTAVSCMYCDMRFYNAPVNTTFGDDITMSGAEYVPELQFFGDDEASANAYMVSTSTGNLYGSSTILFTPGYPKEAYSDQNSALVSQYFVIASNSNNLNIGSFTGIGVGCQTSFGINSAIDYTQATMSDSFSTTCYLDKFTNSGVTTGASLFTNTGTGTANISNIGGNPGDWNLNSWTMTGNFPIYITSRVNIDGGVALAFSTATTGVVYFSTTTYTLQPGALSTTSVYTGLSTTVTDTVMENFIMSMPFGDFTTPINSGQLKGSWTSPDIYASNLTNWVSSSISSSSLYQVAISSISFYYRAAPTATALSTQTWLPLTVGNLSIPAIDYYAQLHVDMADWAVTASSRNYVSSLGLSWKYGSASVGGIPHAMIYNNRYYVAVASSNATTDNLMLKLSVEPAEHWSLYSLGCPALLNYLNSPKCAINGTSKIDTFDTGYSDEGKQISFEWQSGDQLENAAYYPKYLQYILLDYLATASTAFNYGFSIDQGTTFTDYTETSDGSGIREIHRDNVIANQAPQYRLHVTGATNTPITIYGIDGMGFVRPTLAQ